MVRDFSAVGRIFRTAADDSLQRMEDRWRFKHLDPAEWRPRQRYAGVDADGLFMTLKAQPYPWAMCSQLAKCVAKALRDQGLGVRPF